MVYASQVHSYIYVILFVWYFFNFWLLHLEKASFLSFTWMMHIQYASWKALIPILLNSISTYNCMCIYIAHTSSGKLLLVKVWMLSYLVKNILSRVSGLTVSVSTFGMKNILVSSVGSAVINIFRPNILHSLCCNNEEGNH